jgi:hypothetical protein
VHLRSLLPVLFALLLPACQLSLGTDIGVEADGSGVLELTVAVDAELAQLLDDAGVDLTLGLDEASGAAAGWAVEHREDAAGEQLAFRAGFDRPEELADLVADLHAGLDAEDPAILRDVVLDVDDDGRVRFSADAGLVLPTTAGAVGDGVTFDGEDLAALVERDGHRLARYDLRLQLPGTPLAHDADVRDGQQLTWSLPIGELRSIEARSAPPTDRTWLLLAATFVVAAAVAAATVLLVRRVRSRRG